MRECIYCSCVLLVTIWNHCFNSRCNNKVLWSGWLMNKRALLLIIVAVWSLRHGASTNQVWCGPLFGATLHGWTKQVSLRRWGLHSYDPVIFQGPHVSIPGVKTQHVIFPGNRNNHPNSLIFINGTWADFWLLAFIPFMSGHKSDPYLTLALTHHAYVGPPNHLSFLDKLFWG